MEFERVPLPGWHWSVWSEQQTAASSPPRWKRRQVDESVYGKSTGQFETADRCSELDATAAARHWRRKQRRRYERAKQQPTGPGPPAADGTITASIPGSDAAVHVSWQRRRRWKLHHTTTLERRYEPWWWWQWRRWWRWWWYAKQQQQQRIQQYATKFCSSFHEPSSISWIKLFANAIWW